jgi:hypothetical protein
MQSLVVPDFLEALSPAISNFTKRLAVTHGVTMPSPRTVELFKEILGFSCKFTC